MFYFNQLEYFYFYLLSYLHTFLLIPYNELWLQISPKLFLEKVYLLVCKMFLHFKSIFENTDL